MQDQKLENKAQKRSIFAPQSGDKPIVLKNKTCVYCGSSLVKESTKEHVIGRKFVPHLKWKSDWNLIVMACFNCNHHKSKLENDISAISMYVHGQDPEIGGIVHRKVSKSKSAKTGKTVIESIERVVIDYAIAPGVNIKFKMEAPPQIEDRRAFELARLQISAFFYMVTYNESSCLGKFLEGQFSPIACIPKGDWGNVTKKSFMNHVSDWEPRLVGITADGFFKVMLKRHPTDNCFGWALEWNENYRVYGFFGDRSLAESIYKTFPKINKDDIPIKEKGTLVVHEETLLLKDEDTMFKVGVS